MSSVFLGRFATQKQLFMFLREEKAHSFCRTHTSLASRPEE